MISWMSTARAACAGSPSMMFEQISGDLAHYASNVMKCNGFRPHEIPECLQIGFMVLWETLVQQHDFLTRNGRTGRFTSRIRVPVTAFSLGILHEIRSLP